ncbi:MAG: chain length determinant protein tyrosine kinase EpsG [Burkholderiales bacterium RIFCSPLOWO2_02_FULL_57_36]|nr:MAG: chain length determinant protein tyrosine kinase EpsG [Burkholderiales bacterium RIFCSPLOWO2_02_FULL_57_36]
MNPAMLSVPDALKRAGDNQTIGKILLQLGKLTPEDAERVSHYQKECGLRFGEAAQSLGLVSEADVRMGLARQFDYPYLEPGEGAYPIELVAAYQPFSPQVEVMRSVRSELLLRWFDAGHKSLAVAGIDSGDGTSFFMANLGLVFSQMGKRTLLIDANLRSARLHQIFGLHARQGLSDLLVGRAGIESIARVDSFSNLYVLTAGTTPPNPQELISHPSFGKVQENVASRFDVTLIDTSAFAVGADALQVAAKVGGVLLLIRKDKTALAQVDAIGKKLAHIGVPVVGSVLVNF